MNFQEPVKCVYCLPDLAQHFFIGVGTGAPKNNLKGKHNVICILSSVYIIYLMHTSSLLAHFKKSSEQKTSAMFDNQ